MRLLLTALLASAVGVAACGGADTPVPAAPPAAAPPPPSAVASSAPSAVGSAAPVAATPAPHPPGSFFEMAHDAQLKQMKTVVTPTMGKLFTAYDAQKFGSFGCKTCHGPYMEEPRKALPKITLSGNGYEKLMAEKPAIMKFMHEQVTPAMATAMGEPPYDPATHKGFGCGGCHTVN